MSLFRKPRTASAPPDTSPTKSLVPISAKSKIYIQPSRQAPTPPTPLTDFRSHPLWHLNCSLIVMTLLLSLAATLILVALVAWLVNTRIPLAANIKAILNVVLGLIVVGTVLWLINTYVPMAGAIKTILNIVVVVATCVGVLQAVDLWNPTVRLWSNLTHRVPH